MDKKNNAKMTVPQRIKQVREFLGLSQRKFCDLLSLSNGYIGSVETNVLKVNRRLIKLIASEFNVSEEWLLNGSGEMFA